MGNCFKRQGSDDMSLLRGAEQTSTRDSSDPIPSTSRDAIPSTPRGHLPTLSRIQPVSLPLILLYRIPFIHKTQAGIQSVAA